MSPEVVRLFPGLPAEIRDASGCEREGSHAPHAAATRHATHPARTFFFQNTPLQSACVRLGCGHAFGDCADM